MNDQTTRGRAPVSLPLIDAPLGGLALLEPRRNLQERVLLGLAGLFVLLGAVALSLVRLPHGSAAYGSLVVVWGVCFGAAHYALNRYAPDRDPFLLPMAALLTGWGLLLIARLAALSFLVRQSLWLMISVAAYVLIVARSNGLRWLRRYRYTWLLGGLILLATTLVLGKNPSGYGPRLWLGARLPFVGGVYVQPSEILKLLMVIYLASYLAEKRELVADGPQIGRLHLPSLPYLAPLLVMWGLAMVLLAWQQDLGAALLFFFTFLAMLYQASGNGGYVAAGLALFLVAAAGAYVLLDTVALRVDIWLNPWADPDGRAFQVVQSLIAFASGGLFGQGLGQGRPTYIPAIHTDFPLAAIAEEFGLVGIVALISAIAILTARGIRAALSARTAFHQLLSAGLATLLGLQAWVIMAGSARLIPLTGVTLPFVSYGGSSLLSSFIVLGLLTAVSRDTTPNLPLKPVRSDMAGPIRRLSLVLLAAFVGLATLSGYWTLARQVALRERDDNPRLVEQEQRVRRGTILDRNGVILARSHADAQGIQSRAYLTPTVPAVGYYSLKHGVGGIEAGYDALLRGTEGRSDTERFFDALLHRQPDGRSVMLSVDLELQQAATAALDGHNGAVVLLNVETGEILALVSLPTFDPNTLDADWETLEQDPDAPLLNRATQGLYQPGGVLQLVVLAAALESESVDVEVALGDLAQPVLVDSRTLSCARTPVATTVAEAVAAACPAPFARMGEALGADTLEAVWQRWGLDRPPLIKIPTDAGEAQVSDPALAAVGQDDLTVTPLHVARVAAALGNEGVMPAPRLALQTQNADGTWQPVTPLSKAARIITPDLALRLRAMMRPSPDGAAIGHSSIALAGTDLPPHAWYIGLAPAQAPRYAVAVLLEHVGQEGLEVAEKTGADILRLALTPASK